MKNKVNIFKNFIYSIAITSLTANVAYGATLEELTSRANQLQAEISKTAARGEQLDKSIKDIEEKYKEVKTEPKGVDAYNAKIAEAKAKKEKLLKEKKADEGVTNKVKEDTITKKEVTPTKEEKTKDTEGSTKVIPYPFERNPSYEAPKNTYKGRRPFTRSDNEYQEEKIFFASYKNSEALSFAKEETVQAYTGTTEENVFVFSDNLANYCKFDTNSLDKMSECLNKLIAERTGTSQSMKTQINELYQESLMDTSSNAVTVAAEKTNDSSGYESKVLLPLQEKSSQATDERGDIEVLTLTEMEALKLKNKLLQIYATQLGLDSFRDYGTFEVNNRDLTNIDEQSK